MGKVEYELNDAPVRSFIKKQGRGSKTRLCQTVGLSIKWLEKIRRTRRLPTGEHLLALADAIEVNVEDLVIRRPKKAAKSA